MKTTLEITGATSRRAKALAAAKGMTLSQLVTEALNEKLGLKEKAANGSELPWMQGFGRLRDLKAESARIMKLVDAEFEEIGHAR